MNIVIPMAGEGSRFKQAGYTFPKPLIDVEGKPMIQRVVENIGIEDAHYIFLVRQEHIEKYSIDKVVQNLVKKSTVIPVDKLTEGAACTVLLARKQIITSLDSLLIVNSDQLVEWKLDVNNFGGDGHIYVFNDTHPKWSFVEMNGSYIKRVVEKQPISNIATTGIYYWKLGSNFVLNAEKMIENNIRVNNEFYIAPVFNEAIANGDNFTIRYVNKMHGLGTPEDLERYLRRNK